MKPKQPELLPNDQPNTIEVDGAALLTVLADLRNRGAHVLAMHVIAIARYRLALSWGNMGKDQTK